MKECSEKVGRLSQLVFIQANDILPVSLIRTSGPDLRRCHCRNGQRVYLRMHHIVDRIIHESMSCDEFEPFKLTGHNSYMIMPAARRCTGMAGMLRRVVAEYAFERF